MSTRKKDLMELLENPVKIQVDDVETNFISETDFVTAKNEAKQKAKQFCDDPMLLSWKHGPTGDYYPKVECGSSDKPAWIVFAESRGGDLVIDVNDGEYTFIFLSLPEKTA